WIPDNLVTICAPADPAESAAARTAGMNSFLMGDLLKLIDVIPKTVWIKLANLAGHFTQLHLCADGLAAHRVFDVFRDRPAPTSCAFARRLARSTRRHARSRTVTPPADTAAARQYSRPRHCSA